MYMYGWDLALLFATDASGLLISYFLVWMLHHGIMGKQFIERQGAFYGICLNSNG